ncbi:MAG: PKD domain-containing protein [Bacteroidales bacterium]
MRRLFPILFILMSVFQAATAQRYYRVSRLPFSTGPYWESAPVPYRDSIVYISNRPSSSFVRYTNEDNQPFTNIFLVEKKGEDSWSSPDFLSETFQTNFDDGPVTFAQDYQLICFYQAYVAELGESGRRSNPNGGLYFSRRVSGGWTDPEPFEHNDYNYSYYTPWLTEDGTALYFSANLDDSRGDYDIYVSRLVNNSWTIPENLGDQVNTTEREWFPFLHEESGRFYFSSNGHDSFGGFDLFYCNDINGVLSSAIKLPPPINSGADDFALFMYGDFSEGYFSSDRIGGTPDIYRFFSNFPKFEFPRPIQRNRFCFRLRENSLDTIDYTLFDYEWVINDTLDIPGHDIKYCFPGPGDYHLSFNVTNKLTDSVMYDVASLSLQLQLTEQPVITAPDTVAVNQEIYFSSEETYLPEFDIDAYYWDFGDGMKATGKTTTHVFSYPGDFTVVLGVEERVRNRRFEPERIAVFRKIVVLPEE